MKLSQWFPQGGTLEDHKLRKSATEEENSRCCPLQAKKKKRERERDPQEVFYNIKKDSEIQTQRIKKKTNRPGMNQEVSTNIQTETCSYNR